MELEHRVDPEYKTILFYRYVNISEEKVQELHKVLKAVCDVLGLKGRILIAREGINGTVEGEIANIEIFKKHLRSYKYFKKIDIKESFSGGQSFPKMKVKIKEEIVSTKFPKHIDPTKKTARHINAAEVKKMFERQEEFYVVDMRNDYEIASGHFKNTINTDWHMKASRDLPKFVERLKPYKNKKLLTVCTGGVRCEKMSAYLLDQGFTNVLQLHNGIHTYMQKYPGEDFKGTLYTFDNRMTMNFADDKNIQREIVGKCFVCQQATEQYGHCAFTMCHQHLLLCEICSKNKVFCTPQCQKNHDLMQERIKNFMSASLSVEQ